MNGTTTERHPRGLYVLFSTEMWERFSFYTVNAMLSLYLRESFNFSNSQAATVGATYQMFVYFTPLIGGLLADLLLGFRKAIFIGAIFFIAGHALLAVPNSLMIVYAALACLVLGNGLFKPNISSMVGNLYPEGSRLKDKAYLIFYMGINVGAFTAPLVANYVKPRWGFHPAFFNGAIGMVICVIIFALNQKYVRHADRLRGKADPKAVAVTEDVAPLKEEARPIDAVPEWKRIGALIVIFLIVIVFWMVFHQNSISLTFWANDHSYKLPGIISNAVNPFYIIFLALPLASFWSWLDKKGKEPSTPTKIMIGMMLTGLSFVILFFAARAGGFTSPVFKIVKSDATQTWVAISPEAREHLGIKTSGTKIDEKTDGWLVSGAPNAKVGEYVRLENLAGNEIQVTPVARVSRWWLIFAYGVLTLGELMLSPMGLSLVSKVAPIRMRGLMMGGWFAATAIGNLLTGIARYWDLWSHANFFIILASMALFMAFVLLVLLRPLKRAMPGV